jgi:hypothetical protein
MWRIQTHAAAGVWNKPLQCCLQRYESRRALGGAGATALCRRLSAQSGMAPVIAVNGYYFSFRSVLIAKSVLAGFGAAGNHSQAWSLAGVIETRRCQTSRNLLITRSFAFQSTYLQDSSPEQV